jgi:hypothetical protein
MSSPAFACTGSDILQGCIDDDGTGVDLEGGGGTGIPGGGGGGGSGSAGGGGGAGGGGADDPADDVCDLRDCWDVTNPPEPDREVTWADIAHFRPTPGVDHMQPNGWMVVGLPTNFYATGGPHVVTGELLGYPASVRFTPYRWHWTYGDGSAATRSTPGTTWAAQNAREFDATSTSHVYRNRGTYVIDLDIDYTAEYRFAGGPWVPIVGSINLPANRLTATAGSAKTVLVEDPCTRNPRGPGC